MQRAASPSQRQVPCSNRVADLVSFRAQDRFANTNGLICCSDFVFSSVSLNLTTKRSRPYVSRLCLAVVAVVGSVFAGGCTGRVVTAGGASAGGAAGDVPGLRGAGGGAGNKGGGTTVGSGTAQDCSKVAPGAWSMRRLSRTEYDNTVAQLFGADGHPSAGFPADQVLLGFDNNASGASVSDLLVEGYEAAAAQLATNAVKNLSSLLACQSGQAEDDCARAFIKRFGLRALRRPLEDEESTSYEAFYQASKTKYGMQDAIRMVVQAFLQEPSFVYRTELSSGSGGGVVKVAPYELASRLSYLIWSGMPDDALFAAAASGALSAPDELERQARRMLQDPKARKGIVNFYDQWLDIPAVESVEKDAATFPKWTPQTGPLLRRETETFVGALVSEGAGTIDELLRAPSSYMNSTLASFYGVKGPTGDGFEKVQLPANRGGGILSQGYFLAANAAPRQTNPVKRGFYIRDRLLCAPPPPPPADLKVTAPPPDGQHSTRERFALHSKAGSSCAGCHRLMDPIGLGFEHFDGSGQWRDKDEGQPIDATGEIVATVDADGPFDGAAELSKKLAASSQVRSCVVRQHFRFAYGRGEQDEDACVLSRLEDAVAKSGGNLRELLISLTQTEPFLYRPAGSAP